MGEREREREREKMELQIKKSTKIKQQEPIFSKNYKAKSQKR